MQVKSGKVLVNSIYSEKGKIVEEKSEQKQIEIPAFEEGVELTRVSMDLGMTKNMFNYNSAKTSIFVSVPCYLNPEEMANAKKFCENYINEHITPTLDEFISYLKAKKLVKKTQ